MSEATLHVQRLGGHVVLTIAGEVDLENSGRVRERMIMEVPEDAGAIVLDLTSVSYMDSAGVRLLFDFAGRLGERRLDVAIVAPSNSLLRDVLEIVRLEQVAALVETLDDALRLPARGSRARL